MNIQSAFTLLAFAFFIGILVWVFMPSRKGVYEEQGQSVLKEDDINGVIK